MLALGGLSIDDIGENKLHMIEEGVLPPLINIILKYKNAHKLLYEY